MVNILPMIDLENLQVDQNTAIETGNLTPLFNFQEGCFVTDERGRVICDDGQKGMETIIAKAHATARRSYAIYSEDYGSDEKAVLKKAVPEVARQMLIKEAIRDCLVYDNRIKEVSEITLERLTDGYKAMYTVYTIFGEVEVKREVI